MPTKPNDAAFARPCSEDTSGDYPTPVEAADGLIKREYFAAMAMQGLLADSDGIPSMPGRQVYGYVAGAAVEYADALIAALNGEGSTNG